MNWELVRFDWTRARAFWVTAETGSLSSAARALGLSQPTLGRQIEALEAELGAVLFERVGKRLVLTPGGLELLEHVRAMGEAAQRVTLAAAGQAQALEGVVRLSVGEIVAAHVLPAALGRLRAEHPGLTLSVLATGRISDLQMREADVAVRNVKPTQPELVARRLADLPAGLYAARSYLDRVGRSPEALHSTDYIGFDDPARMVEALRPLGLTLAPERFRLLTEAHSVQWEWVRRGLGIGVMVASVGDADPLVERVLPEATIPVPMWLVAHREVRTSRRVRVVFDALAEVLG